jgi:1-phosphofructokinase
LRELSGEQLDDRPVSLANAGRKLLDRVEVVLISRGKKGAIVVTEKGAWRSRSVGRGRVLSTVGCGDYLLAGFLKGLKDYSGTDAALKTAIKVATAKAWGRTESTTWPRVKRQIEVESGHI